MRKWGEALKLSYLIFKEAPRIFGNKKPHEYKSFMNKMTGVLLGKNQLKTNFEIISVQRKH